MCPPDVNILRPGRDASLSLATSCSWGGTPDFPPSFPTAFAPQFHNHPPQSSRGENADASPAYAHPTPFLT